MNVVYKIDFRKPLSNLPQATFQHVSGEGDGGARGS